MKSLVTPHNQTALGFGSTLVKLSQNDTEFGPNAQTFESIAERRAREMKQKKKEEKEKAAMFSHVDPSQSRSTTNRINNWINSFPEKPDLDQFVEEMNLTPLPNKLKECKPRPGDGDKYSINFQAIEAQIKKERDKEREKEAMESLQQSLGSNTNIAGMNLKDRIGRDRSRAASKARSAAQDEAFMDIQLGEEAGGMEDEMNGYMDQPVIQTFNRNHGGAGNPYASTNRNDDVKMM